MADEFDICVLADLSEVPVFAETGAYVLLLIARKKVSGGESRQRKALIIRCRDFVGHALQDGLAGKLTTGDYYSIYELEQAAFSQERWHILPSKQIGMWGRLSRLPTLESIVSIHQGFVTGCDPVFICKSIPENERAAYLPYLSDRKMGRYAVPNRTDEFVFYPYVNGTKLDERTLESRFPATWAYLNGHKKTLMARRPVKERRCAWWCPDQSRPPDRMLRAKIVVPHLILIPAFCLDDKGKYAVSRSPLLYREDDNLDVLRYVLAVLNSSVGYWQIAATSFKYSRGYARLEVKTLRALRIPAPASITPAQMRRIQSSVDKLLRDPSDQSADAELDDIMADVHGLSSQERAEIGLGG